MGLTMRAKVLNNRGTKLFHKLKLFQVFKK